MHDELRRLDDDLAAGRLDADSYGSRRDELLAAARPPEPAPTVTANGDAATNGHAESGATPVGPAAPPSSDPFPPPFRWGGERAPAASDDGAPGPDSTQVVAASLAEAVGAGPERTQVVRHRMVGTPGDPTRVVDRATVRGADPWLAPGASPTTRPRPLAPPARPVPPERTQFVPGAALARTAGRRAVSARQTTPPWVGERSTSPSDGRMQGREVFTRGGPSVGTVVGTAAVVLVVLAVLVLSFVLR